MMKSVVTVLFLVLLCTNVVQSLKGPSDLKILSYNETEVTILWSPINLINVNVTGYHVKITPLKSHSPTHSTMAIEITTPNTKTSAAVQSLHPGTQYNVTVVASTPSGLSESSNVVFWTEVGRPNSPPAIDIQERDGKIMKVKLVPGESDKGPISAIRVVVLEKTTIISFNEEQLFNYSMAEESGLPFYVAASLPENEITDHFTVGDGKSYGGFFNAPLKENLNYEVLQGSISTLNGVTKAAYSPLQTNVDLGIVYTNQVEADWATPGLSKILGIAIGIFGFLLIVSFLLYFLLRRHYGKRRLSDEMVLHDQITDAEENGFAQGVLRLGEDTNLGDFWEILKERYWSIPKNLLQISEQVLGNGHFGEVRKGVVHKRGKPIDVLIQLTQSHSVMGDKEKLSLYSEIDAELRLSSHPNVAEFIGICEDRGVLHLVAESYDTSLRGLLLRSRQQTGPKFSNMSENFILELALGIAKGMKYISDFGVMHKHLSSRSVAITDGYQPKITNFGLFFYHPAGKKLDNTRWVAPEKGRMRTYTSKADVWSFGVLLWEICTLGATPYSDMPTQEVYPRTMRGLRLPRPPGVADELFQLMLQCWELDPDERPSFQELVTVLQNMTPTEQLCFERTPAFQFHKFDPKGDEQ